MYTSPVLFPTGESGPQRGKVTDILSGLHNQSGAKAQMLPSTDSNSSPGLSPSRQLLPQHTPPTPTAPNTPPGPSTPRQDPQLSPSLCRTFPPSSRPPGSLHVPWDGTQEDLLPGLPRQQAQAARPVLPGSSFPASLPELGSSTGTSALSSHFPTQPGLLAKDPEQPGKLFLQLPLYSWGR